MVIFVPGSMQIYVAEIYFIFIWLPERKSANQSDIRLIKILQLRLLKSVR